MSRLTEKAIPKAGYVAKYKATEDFADWECIDKLGQLEDAEEQGLLLRLPCKLGTTVYYVQKCLFPGTCANCRGFIRVSNCHTEYKARIFEQSFNYWHLSAFGKTVFLTKEEAEAALQAMEQKEGK